MNSISQNQGCSIKNISQKTRTAFSFWKERPKQLKNSKNISPHRGGVEFFWEGLKDGQEL